MNGSLRPFRITRPVVGGERGTRHAAALVIFLSALLVWETGCASSLRTKLVVPGPIYVPTNVFRAGEKLPASLKRVAILPMSPAGSGTELAQAPATLEPLLLRELGKSARFEVIPLTATVLKQATGKSAWNAADVFPTNFFDRLRSVTGCDAVLFSEVTVYKPYPPMVMGLRLRLMDVDGPTVWWAVDEVFDAAEAAVANAAKRHHLSNAGKPAELTDPGEVLLSPRRFGGYAAHALVNTCPRR